MSCFGEAQASGKRKGVNAQLSLVPHVSQPLRPLLSPPAFPACPCPSSIPELPVGSSASMALAAVCPPKPCPVLRTHPCFCVELTSLLAHCAELISGPCELCSACLPPSLPPFFVHSFIHSFMQHLLKLVLCQEFLSIRDPAMRKMG